MCGEIKNRAARQDRQTFRLFMVPMQGDVARIRGEVTVHAAIAGSIVPGVAKLPVSSA
jgi:hypothetical protein